MRATVVLHCHAQRTLHVIIATQLNTRDLFLLPTKGCVFPPSKLDHLLFPGSFPLRSFCLGVHIRRELHPSDRSDIRRPSSLLFFTGSNSLSLFSHDNLRICVQVASFCHKISPPLFLLEISPFSHSRTASLGLTSCASRTTRRHPVFPFSSPIRPPLLGPFSPFSFTRGPYTFFFSPDLFRPVF